MPETLDISNFRDAIAELERMYAYAQSNTVTADPRLFGYMRTATIKGFEYSYELAHKSLRRFLDIYAASRESGSDYLFPELLRSAQEFGLIDDMRVWMDFRTKRNITSHTYQSAKAEDIFAIIPDFLKHAQELRRRLEQQIQANS